MEFITIMHPSQSSSKRSKRQAHSHAARVAHARTRRQRMAEYRDQEMLADKIEDSQEGKSQTTQARRQQTLISFIRSFRAEITLVIPRTVSGAFLHEPLTRFLASLTSREHFVFNYYINVVLPQMTISCPVIRYVGQHSWILVSSTDVGLLRGWLLSACRHLSMSGSDEEYAELAVQYKLRYLQNLREIISSGNLSLRRTAVTLAIVLAFDDIMVRDFPMASQHILGALHIIQAAGGVKALGLSDLVRSILYSCLYAKTVLDWEKAVMNRPFMPS